MRKNWKIKITILIMTALLANCSVYKAASNEGISVSDIKKCKVKECFLTKGMEIVDRSQNEKETTEIYRALARKSGFNYVRAAGHGVLDLATLGVWEVVGSPIEGIISNNRGYITAKIKYSDENNTSIEIFDVKGNKVVLN